MPGHARALGRRQRRQARCTSSSSASRSITIPWTPLEGSPAARWAAAARLRTVPPIPTSRRPPAPAAARQPAAPARARCATCSRSSSSCLRLAGPFGGRKRSLISTVPTRQDPHSRGEAPAHAHELQRAAAEVEHAAVAERGRVDRREVAVAGLLLAAEHADRQPEALARALEEAPRRSRRRGSRSSRPRRPPRRRGRSRGRSGRTRRASRARAPSAPRRGSRSRAAPRRCAPARRSHRCASTSPRPP